MKRRGGTAMAYVRQGPAARDRGVGGFHADDAGARRAAARLPAPVRRRGQHHQDRGHRRLGRGRLRSAERARLAGRRTGAAAGIRPGAGPVGLLPQRFTAADRPLADSRRARRGRPGDCGGRRRGDVRRGVGDLHGSRRRGRRRLPAQALPARRPPPAKTRRGRPRGYTRHRLPAARRRRVRGAAACGQGRRDADRRRLDGREPPAHALAHRLVQPDRRRPARHPARLQPRCARLPLVREGQRPGHGQQPALERRRTAAPCRRAHRRRGLLTVDGASRGNLFSGGADQVALVLSVAVRRGRANRSRAGYFAYFSDPANAVRTAMSFVAEVAREIGQSTRARLRGDRPRIKRGGLYPSSGRSRPSSSAMWW